MRKYRIIISGGGTGGHIFPAISIANTFKKRFPDAEILFVGAEDRMEMDKVPAAGYKIVGLPVSGFDRAHLMNNVKVMVRLAKSLRLARKTIREFKPDIAVGVPVTVRDRDTMEQVRVKIEELEAYFADKFTF